MKLISFLRVVPRNMKPRREGVLEKNTFPSSMGSGTEGGDSGGRRRESFNRGLESGSYIKNGRRQTTKTEASIALKKITTV